MKKTYKNPTLKVVKIQPAHLLAGSDIRVGAKYQSGDVVLGRESRFSTWEEEEGEE